MLARKTTQSEIWQKKPAWWFKVWCYILMRVNHKSNNRFKRGENFFTYHRIYDDCNLSCEGNDTRSLDNLIRWLKRTTQITTQKTTRGFIISVSNYDLYQNIANYKNDTGNDTGNESETIQERYRNDTINKNDKNVNNEKNEKKKIRENPHPKNFSVYMDIWNKKMLWKLRELTPKRKERLNLRLKNLSFKNNYEKILDLILESDFLTGRKPSEKHPNFKADFDWITRNDDNYIKVLEGKYLNTQGAKNAEVGIVG